MLFIGQPKSASTSLLFTLAKILKMKPKRADGKIKMVKGKIVKTNWKPCEGFPEIQKYHDTTIKRNQKYFIRWMNDKKVIYREHILPTKEHKQFIKRAGKKILILLRNPEDCINNYKRMYQKWKNNELTKKEIAQLFPQRFDSISFEGLLKDFCGFYEGWKTFDYDKKYIVYYKDLVLNYKQTMTNVLKFLGVKVPKNIIPFEKSKYRRGYQSFTGNGIKKLKGK
jgi:hypothetical protein